MAVDPVGVPSIDRVKRDAKRIKRDFGLVHARALDAASQKYGFNSWHHFLRVASARAATEGAA